MTTELKTIIGIGTLTIGLFIGAIWWMSQGQSPAGGQADPNRLITSDSPRIGSASAKVTLVEFGDYQCPSCAVSHPVVKELLEANPAQVSFVFRHFPLSQHPLAPLAAEAAEAAGEQGKYWEMHNALYERQTEWSVSADPLKVFESYAQTIGLDVAKFTAAINSNKFAGKIQQGLADGNNLGVNATPTFYINGQEYTGTTGGLKQAIQKILETN
jgi:protein-disulfide isomerase